MKRFRLLLLLLITSVVLKAQSPPYIPYQAIARDVTGQIKANTPIQVEFKIYNTMVASASSYDEVHSVTTNDFGYFNLRIGGGTIQSGAFSSINWQTGDVGYEVWVDMGLGFSQLGGRTGFLSVPYAMYAANSNPNPTITINSPNTIANTAPATYSINVPTPTLSINGSTLSISNGNTVALPGYVQGAGIGISGNTISNTAPDQTVSITGADVTGAYPNFTINPAASTAITSGNSNIIVSGSAPSITITSTPSLSIVSDQLSLSNGNTVTIPTANLTQGQNVNVTGTSSNYTISAVTPTLLATGNATVNGAYPNQTIDVPAQTLSISGNTINLSSGGGSVTLPSSAVTTIDQGQNISVNGTSPNFTISAVTPTLLATGNASINGSYPNQVLTVVSQTLSVSGNTLNLSEGGGSVVLPSTAATTITQGNNISVNGAAPDYTISAVTPTLLVTGNASVTGTYPNQTITVPAQTLSVSGNTLNLSSGGGSVTLPSTPATTITQGSNVTVNGTAPNYTISSASQTLSISGNTLNLSAGGGSVTLPSTQATTITPVNSNVTISGTAPNYTIGILTPTLTGSGNASVGGSYPNQTITVPAQTLSISGNTLNLSSGGGSVTLPSTPATTITQGSNVTVSGTAPNYTISANTQTTSIAQGANVIVNGTSPNYTVSAVTPTLTGNGNVSVGGSYPNQTITVPAQTLSVSGNTLNLSSGGGSVTLPSTPATTITQGSNVTVSGTAPNYTISANTQTTSIAPANSNVTVSGTAPNYTIGILTPTLTGNGNASVGGSYPNQTITVPAQTLSVSGNTVNLSNGGGAITLPVWNTAGNGGTSPATNFIGTTDANAFAVRTNNTERLRVTSTGSVVIGTSTTTPAANFDVNTGNVKLGALSDAFSTVKYGAISTSILLSIGNNAGTVSIPGAQVGDVIVVTLNNHNAAAGSIYLNNAYVSAANTLSFNVNTGVGLLATLNFSYILMRP